MRHKMDNTLNKVLSRRYLVLFLTGWTFVIIFSFLWNYGEQEDNIKNAAKDQAEIAYKKDLIYRRWNSMNGGVYIPVSDKVKPNPHLKIESRDITDTNGKVYTLINPSYMTRQVYDIAKEEFGIIGHMTSLRPIRPENAPDDWERKALLNFEKGITTETEIVTINGKDILRYMKPFVTEESCLKCHGYDGFKVGDIRGGISIGISMLPFYASLRHQLFNLSAAHGIIWLLGSGVILFAFRELKKYSESLIASEARLRKMNNTKDKLFSIIAHDLRSPFQGYLGLIELLTENRAALSENEFSKLTVDLDASAHNLYRLIENLLDWFKMQRGYLVCSPDCVDISALADHNISLVKYNALQKNITVVNSVPAGTSAYCDEMMINTVLRNLVSNAVKFSKHDGRINITAEDNGGYVHVSVADTGIGISPENLETIFDFEKKKVTKGTDGESSSGLGLLLCKDFVEENNGKIRVQSAPGEGSVFTFSLPKCEDEFRNNLVK